MAKVGYARVRSVTLPAVGAGPGLWPLIHKGCRTSRNRLFGGQREVISKKTVIALSLIPAVRKGTVEHNTDPVHQVQWLAI